MYKRLIKPILFLFNPERAHHLVCGLMKTAFSIPFIKGLITKAFKYQNQNLERELFGLKFPNPIGLAAGFDKDASMFSELGAFGFGFIEVGTVTPKGQEGNPKPRMFRLKKDQALINRMGFNNHGVDQMVERLRNRDKSFIIGGNIGKNKLTPNEKASEDYKICFEKLFDVVDYFVVNVSSPNTPNLRDLQDKEPLSKLLLELQEFNNQKNTPKPILLKIAPDLTNEALDDIIDLVKITKIDGVIATNTTISRTDLLTDKNRIEHIGAGGLSGKILLDRSTTVVKYLKEKSNNAFPVIAVGGVFTAEDAIQKLEAGADLVQVYTGFIYEGPAMIKRINKGIARYYESKGN